jgi:flagellar biosynthesis protein FliQ
MSCLSVRWIHREPEYSGLGLSPLDVLYNCVLGCVIAKISATHVIQEVNFSEPKVIAACVRIFLK